IYFNHVESVGLLPTLFQMALPPPYYTSSTFLHIIMNPIPESASDIESKAEAKEKEKEQKQETIAKTATEDSKQVDLSSPEAFFDQLETYLHSRVIQSYQELLFIGKLIQECFLPIWFLFQEQTTIEQAMQDPVARFLGISGIEQ